MLCGVNWRLESACGFSEGVREDAPLIIRWSADARDQRSPLTLFLTRSDSNFTKRQETEKNETDSFIWLLSPRIHFMEYYETRTEVFVLWFKLEVTGIVVSRKWADFVQFLLWTIGISACEHRGIFMLFLVWLGFIFKQQNLRMIWILCNSE